MRSTLNRKDWPAGDRTRMINVKKISERAVPPDDVTKTYGHVFLHDVRYGETIKARPSLYISAHLEKKYLLDDGYYWDGSESRLRLVKKDDAVHSAVVSGIDDFWFEDYGDPSFVVMTNMRQGRKLIRYLISKEWLPEILEKLGVLPVLIMEKTK